MTMKEKMFLYGLTEEDMNANIEQLSANTLLWRFLVEFGGDFGCFQTGDYGYFDGENFRLRPENASDEDETNLIKESLKARKNLFIEKWTNVARFKSNLEY